MKELILKVKIKHELELKCIGLSSRSIVSGIANSLLLFYHIYFIR